MNSEIKRIAPILNNLKPSKAATFEYQAVCDALVWSDELPQQPLSDELAIRYLLRYRTSVILGEPITAISPYWGFAKEVFPKWPGFRPERCQHSDCLAIEVRKMQAAMNIFFDAE